MKKKFIASIYNEHIYVKWLKNAFNKGKEFLNIYRNKAVKKEKETGFKNGRLLVLLKKRGMGLAIPLSISNLANTAQ